MVVGVEVVDVDVGMVDVDVVMVDVDVVVGGGVVVVGGVVSVNVDVVADAVVVEVEVDIESVVTTDCVERDDEVVDVVVCVVCVGSVSVHPTKNNKANNIKADSRGRLNMSKSSKFFKETVLSLYALRSCFAR